MSGSRGNYFVNNKNNNNNNNPNTLYVHFMEYANNYNKGLLLNYV